MAKTFTINADSIPVLDKWGFDDYWLKEDWTKWVTANVKKYGKKKARDKFIDQWERQDLTANPYNWAKYDSKFTTFLKKEIDVDISSIISAPIVGTEKVVKGVSNAAGNIGDSVGSAGKNFKYIIIIVAAILTIALIYYAYTQIKKNA